MRFLIFSDSHGSASNMREAVRRNRDTNLDGIIFLGDGLKSAKEVADESKLELYAVAGNCDFGVDVTNSFTYEKLLAFEGYKIFIVHGHKYMVKSTGDIVNNRAISLGADILLYGHTHLRNDTTVKYNDERILRIFNPGSISLPPDGIYSFGLLELTKSGIYLSHGEI